MLLVFGLTLFLSACLLFLAEPMFARMVLPLLGGTPAVWNTCMVFFQAALLAGYAYAHASASRLGRRQIPIQIGLMLLPLIFLPIAIPPGWSPPAHTNPISSLLKLMLLSVGLPFAVVSTMGPLLQKWVAYTDHPAAEDPYFLYTASNFGSMVGLIGYVAAVEPHFTLTQQSHLWAGGYVLLVAMTGMCAIASLRGDSPRKRSSQAATAAATSLELIHGGRRLRWTALAFAPSSLMLGVTSFLTTDVAAVPLLWIAPLALYLLTFMLAFSRRTIVPRRFLVPAAPWLIMLQLFLLVCQRALPGIWPMVVHLAAFFVTAWACHSELAQDRPSADYLTGYYLLLSLGGALGGILNAVIAPMVFNSVKEFPLLLVLVCVLLRRQGQSTEHRFHSKTIAGAIGLAVFTLSVMHGASQMHWSSWLILATLVGLLLVACAFAREPLRFGLAIGAVLLASGGNRGIGGQMLVEGRSFYGVYRVSRDADGNFVTLLHGTTMHGKQSLDPARRGEPLTYYFRDGPIGHLFGALHQNKPQAHVTVVGLGTGTVAAYASPGDRFTFYEIDPAIQTIASDARYFTFLQDARDRGAEVHVVVGDARLTLKEAPAGIHDLVILDAFSSDAIPTHLLTRQAFQLYLDKLKSDGLLLVHVSSRYVDLRPVLRALADDMGLVCIESESRTLSRQEIELGKTESIWMLLARNRSNLRELDKNAGWHQTTRSDRIAPWTDDFSNIIQLIKWR